MPTESQLRDTALRLRIRELIEDGHLPVIVPKQIGAGYGSNQLCAACAQPITKTQIEYDVTDYHHRKRLYFHMGCHVVWQLECIEALRRDVRLDNIG
jgi:hypothetical protein